MQSSLRATARATSIAARATDQLMKRFALMVMVLASIASFTPASAQNYPTRPIKVVVPFTAGGGSDITARMVTEQMAPKLGQPMIVENRPGASAAVVGVRPTLFCPTNTSMPPGTVSNVMDPVLGAHGS